MQQTSVKTIHAEEGRIGGYLVIWGSHNQRDRYGRIVGKLVKNGRDINLKQVKDGFAWHYKKYQRELSPADRLK